MAKSWSEVVSSPEYQALKPHDQIEAKQEYFNSVVAPQVAPIEVQDAHDEFFGTKETPNQSPIETPSKGIDFSSPLALGESLGEKAAVPVMQVPSAAIRSAIQGKGYLEGAVNPERVPTFQDLAIQKTNDLLPEKTGVAGRFAAGVIPSAVGMAADVATNPAMVLSMLLGKFPTGGGTNLAGRLATTPIVKATSEVMNTPITMQGVANQMRVPQVPPDASKIVPQIEKLTTEILQPPKSELQNSLNQGKQHPAVEQAAKVITKSKDYTELRNNLGNEIKSKFSYLRKKYESDNFLGGDEYLTPLRNLISKAREPGSHVTDSELGQMLDVLKEEESFLQVNRPVTGGFTTKGISKQITPQKTKITGDSVKNTISEPKYDPEKGAYVRDIVTPKKFLESPDDIVAMDNPKTGRTITSISPKTTYSLGPEMYGGPKVSGGIRRITRLEAQERKEMLQDLTEKLLERRSDGEPVITQPARKLALDAVRQGLREFVSGGDPEVYAINSTYEGLKDAKWLAAGQEALAQKKVPESMLKKIIGLIRRDPSSSVMDAAFQRDRSLGKVTGQIEKLNKILKGLKS